MNDARKILTVRALTVITILSGAWSYLALAVSGSGWVIPAWWLPWPLAICAVLSLVAVFLSWTRPRQIVPFVLNGVVALAHLIHWGRFFIWLERG